MKANTFFKVAATAALIVGMTAPAIAAGGWVLAADSADSNLRFLVETSQLEESTNRHGVAVLGIPVRSVSNGNSESGYVVIEASSCGNAGGEMAMQFDKNLTRYWWSNTGSRIYDKVGASICQIKSAEATAQLALIVDNFAKSKPPTVFERVRSAMADAIEANSKLTLEEAYVIAVNSRYEVSARNYKDLGLTESDYKKLSVANQPTPSSLLGI